MMVNIFYYSRVLVFLITCHTFSDFVLQTDQMAINKSKSIKWLSIHVAAYTGGMLVLNISGVPLVGIGLVYYILFNGAMHWIIDFFTSKISSYFWKKEDRHNFFVVIGIDQLLHISLLILTFQLFVK